jgi:hypothetical protein
MKYFLQIIGFKEGKAHFVSNRTLREVEDTQVSLERKPSVLEVGSSSS